MKNFTSTGPWFGEGSVEEMALVNGGAAKTGMKNFLGAAHP